MPFKECESWAYLYVMKNPFVEFMIPFQNQQSLYPPAVSLVFEARNGPWTS